jgi:type I restriction enzyme, S subunit
MALTRTWKSLKVKPNDVLLNITGASIGRCCIVPADFGEANVNQHVCIIRPNRQIEYRFLHNYISSNNGQAQIFSSEKGISREGLNFEQLKGFQILVPPLNNQKDITDYIKSATTKIDQTTSKIENQIDLLKEYRTALISEVVTGKIDVRT